MLFRSMCIGHATPEAAVGGPLALVRNGDVIDIDARTGTLNIRLSDAEIEERRKQWRPTAQPHAGLLEKYALTVRSASVGAVTHSGAVTWPETPLEDL